ncbi:S23 ribosomal protein (plasmid) [Cylindrospermum stagnale PCC 7417]|uniref:S23 ribosomal protein n=1 Tax=Cylindrospermum stagnale PCC 7417 TaxID=56107 RepID=K9X860_9NOST|nr:S23 ribosomal protein [Cylindrospermum stagnale PCC 7417]
MSYRNQFIWQRAVQLAINCYKFTRLFTQSELYDLTSQIRGSSVFVALHPIWGIATIHEKFRHIA